jgi:hypothetical protein
MNGSFQLHEAKRFTEVETHFLQPISLFWANMLLLFADIRLHQIPADSSYITRGAIGVSVQYGSPLWSILLILVFAGQSGFDAFRNELF